MAAQVSAVGARGIWGKMEASQMRKLLIKQEVLLVEADVDDDAPDDDDKS